MGKWKSDKRNRSGVREGEGSKLYYARAIETGQNFERKPLKVSDQFLQSYGYSRSLGSISLGFGRLELFNSMVRF